MADFIASSVAGAAAIVLGNPIDVIKVKLQTGTPSGRLAATAAGPPTFETWTSLFRGSAAPVVGNAALNALLFVGYNRTLSFLEPSSHLPANPPALANVWMAGAASGLACFVVSAPVEIVKCRAQVSNDRHVSSWKVAVDIWTNRGLRGFYYGGAVTSMRDSIGYGWYFWSYELSKRLLGLENETISSLVAGGIAGCVTWASIYPLDVIKTRVQTQQDFLSPQSRPLLVSPVTQSDRAMTSLDHARAIYRTEGVRGYFSGFWWCMARSFFVNALQWSIYEYLMRVLSQQRLSDVKSSFDPKYNYD